jgi:hypothetical protein
MRYSQGMQQKSLVGKTDANVAGGTLRFIDQTQASAGLVRDAAGMTIQPHPKVSSVSRRQV